MNPTPVGGKTCDLEDLVLQNLAEIFKHLLIMYVVGLFCYVMHKESQIFCVFISTAMCL